MTTIFSKLKLVGSLIGNCRLGGGLITQKDDEEIMSTPDSPDDEDDEE